MKMEFRVNSPVRKQSVIGFLILFIFSASIICAQQTEEKPQSFSEKGTGKAFPIFRIGSHIFAKAKLNGDEKYWVIDSGAGSTVIDTEYAKSRMLPELGKSKAMGANGPVEISIYSIPKLVINDYGIENVSVIGFDVYGLFKKKYNIEVAGILGFNILSKYVVKVDYSGMTMTLFGPSAFKYKGSGNKIDFQMFNNIIMVPLKVNNKYEGMFALDTGASTSAFNYPYAVKNKITEMDGPDFMAFGAQGGFVLKQVRFPVVEFGGYTLNNVVMSYMVEKTAGILGTDAFSGNIGINILQNFLIYIDYPKKILYLEKSPNFNREFPLDKSGMQLEVNKDNAYKIVYVSKNSAAQKAGLNVGDILLSINGKKTADTGGIDEIYSIFKDKDGTRIDLKILRDSKEYEIPIVLADPFKSK
jgi:predicted aspartyl protease